MASSYTLAQLKTDIKDFVEDQGTDFDTTVENIIKLAEDKCLIDLDLDIFDSTGAVTLTGSSQTATVPTDFIKVRSLFYTSGTTRAFLEQRTYEYLIDYWPDTSQTGTPLYWAPLTTTTVQIAPTPSTTLAATARGVKRPNSVVTDTTGSWLSLYCGSLLLKACLVVAEQFNLAMTEAKDWKAEYAEDLALRRLELQHLMHKDYGLPAIPEGK